MFWQTNPIFNLSGLGCGGHKDLAVKASKVHMQLPEMFTDRSVNQTVDVLTSNISIF